MHAFRHQEHINRAVSIAFVPHPDLSAADLNGFQVVGFLSFLETEDQAPEMYWADCGKPAMTSRELSSNILSLLGWEAPGRSEASTVAES